MKKVIAFDCETTGINPEAYALITISGAIVIEGVVQEYFDFKMAPLPNDQVTAEALEVNCLSVEEIDKYPDPIITLHRDVLPMLDKYINKYDKKDKFYPFGYNVGFDQNFFNTWVKKCGIKYGVGSYMHWCSLDLMQVVNVLEYTGVLPDSLPNRKLSTIAAHYGVPLEAHVGLSDIKATLLLGQMITKYARFENIECDILRQNYG